MVTKTRPAAREPLLARLCLYVLQHRRVVAAVWVVLTVAGFAAAGPAYKALSDQYTVPGREGYQTNRNLARLFDNGGSTPPLVATVSLPQGARVGTPAVQSGLRQLSTSLAAAIPGARVASYASTGNRAFVSADGHTTFVVAYPVPEAGSFGQSPKAMKAARRVLSGAHVAGGVVQLTGVEPLTGESGQKGGLGLAAEGLVGALGALLVLAWVFGSVIAVVPLIIAIVSIMTSFLCVWLLTAVTSVSTLVAFLIALVGLGIAIDYSLLIVVRWREELARGLDEEEAVVRAMSTAGRSVLFSATTVGIGLLALVALPLPFMRSVGYGGVLIPLSSVAVATTLLPIILLRFGRRLSWPRVRSEARASRAWTRWAQTVVDHRWIAAGVGIAVLAALMLAAGSLHLGAATGEPNTISQHGPAHTGLVALERSGIGSGALTPTEILTRGPDPALARALSHLQGVQGAVAPSDPRWTADGRSALDVFAHTDASGTVDRVREVAHRLAPNARVGGIVAQNSDFISATYDSFPLMIGVIALITFLLLARALRSVLLPLKAVLLNIASVGAAWGVLTLVWQDGHGSQALWGIHGAGSIPSWLPLVVFAFLYGLSMDYEVFILTRVREEYDATGDTDAAIVRGIGRTGRLVTSAALILFLGFVAMSSAPNTSLKMMATGLGAGIIIDATVIRSLLVPAMLSLLGKWNWWIPGWLEGLLRIRSTPADVAWVPPPNAQPGPVNELVGPDTMRRTR